MKIRTNIKSLLFLILIPMLSCGDSEKATQEARAKEQQRQEEIRRSHKKEKRDQFIAAKKEEERERARLEEEKREKEMMEGPDWLQGTWKLPLKDDYGRSLGTMYMTFKSGTVTTEAGDIEFDNKYHLSSDLSTLYMEPNGKLYLKDGKVYTAEWEPMQKVSGKYASGSSKSSRNNNYSQNSNPKNEVRNFMSSTDVLDYLSQRTFYNSGTSVRITFDAVYLSGTPITGAPRVTNISGTKATVVANSPYSGGAPFYFYIDKRAGTITQKGDVYRER